MRRFCALVLVVVGLLAGRAWGCSCMGSGACHAMPFAGTLFVGDVLAVKEVPAMGEHWARRSFRFKVTESLSGPQRVGDEVEVSTGRGGGDCGYGFTVGERYFVDAYGNAGALSTGICSHTLPLAAAGTLLRELHAEAAGERLPDLTGAVKSTSMESWGSGAAKNKPLAGVEVLLTSQRDGSVHRATTDADGIYTLAVLPPGKYSVKAMLPPKMTTYDAAYGKPTEIEVTDAHGAGAACHLDIYGYPSGSIRGTLRFPDGKPVDGLISAYRVGAPAGVEQGGGWLVGKDGTFELDLLAAGDYLLRVGAEDGKCYSNSWYPGTGDKAEAKLIHVEDGAATTGIDFVFRH